MYWYVHILKCSWIIYNVFIDYIPYIITHENNHSINRLLLILYKTVYNHYKLFTLHTYTSAL